MRSGIRGALVGSLRNSATAGAESAGHVSVVHGSAAGADNAHPQVLSRTTAWLPADTGAGKPGFAR